MYEKNKNKEEKNKNTQDLFRRKENVRKIEFHSHGIVGKTCK